MLNTVEFKTKIKNGIIKIPEEYLQDLIEGNEVQVIVTKQSNIVTSQAQKAKDIIDDLTEKPTQVDGFLSHQEIYDAEGTLRAR